MISEILKKILPPRIVFAAEKLNSDKLCELRLRSGRAVAVWYCGNYYYLSPNGLSNAVNNALTVNNDEIREIVMRACDKSLYAVNDHICNGFLTIRGGIRIGLAGETVFEGSEIKTIKNFTALNIRIPHEVLGCCDEIIGSISCERGYLNTLIISPPGAGKTTVLRDIARNIASDKRICNVLIADERDEIAAVHNGVPTLDVGQNSDIVSGCTKDYAFIRAIRAMRPDIIITDELSGKHDVYAVKNAIDSGVCVIASVHADNHLKLKNKSCFAELLHDKYFERYVVLSDSHGPGTVEGIYDENLQAVAEGKYT